MSHTLHTNTHIHTCTKYASVGCTGGLHFSALFHLLQLLDEVRLVGTHKMEIHLAADKVGEVVIILKDLPTRKLFILSTESTCAQVVPCSNTHKRGSLSWLFWNDLRV